MGYGFGAFLLVVGLVLAFAVNADVSGLEIETIGFIMAAVGLAVIALTAITWNSGRRARTVETVTNPDGTQSTVERRSQT